MLNSCELSAVGLKPIAAVLQTGCFGSNVRVVSVERNPLGDAGVVALAGALPAHGASLWELDVADAEVGDDGFVALAAALPNLSNLSKLHCGYNPAGPRGWSSLAASLPAVPRLNCIYASDSPGMGPAGAEALIAAVRECGPALRSIQVGRSGLTAEQEFELLTARRGPNQLFVDLGRGYE